MAPVARWAFKTAASIKNFSRRAARRFPFYINSIEMGARLQISVVPPLNTHSGEPDCLDVKELELLDCNNMFAKIWVTVGIACHRPAGRLVPNFFRSATPRAGCACASSEGLLCSWMHWGVSWRPTEPFYRSAMEAICNPESVFHVMFFLCFLWAYHLYWQ